MDAIIALFAEPSTWVALLTLVALEVVLGIDNLIFISILTNKLPEAQRASARRIGIGLALVMRLGLLATIAFMVGLTAPVVTLAGQALSWRDIILIAGGLFLVWKAGKEVLHLLRPTPASAAAVAGPALGFGAAIAQIVAIDLVFSLDSIITAVGMTPHVPIMVVAVIITVAIMLFAAAPLADFINANPGVVMLALAFLLMIGGVLIGEGLGLHIDKTYVYAAMGFSVAVESLNILARRAQRALA